MRTVRLRLSLLMLSPLLIAGLLPVSQAQSRGTANQGRPARDASPGRNPTPTNASPTPRQSSTVNPNAIVVRPLKLEPSTVEFQVYEAFTEDTKNITIGSESNDWIFVRLKPWPKHLQFRVNSPASNRQTIGQSETISPDQWFAFRNRITVAVILGKEDAANADRVVVTLENGSATMPVDSRESADQVITTGAIKSEGQQTITVEWKPLRVVQQNETDPGTILLWLVVLAVVLIVLAILFHTILNRWHWRFSDLFRLPKILRRKWSKQGAGQHRERYQEDTSSRSDASLTELKNDLVGEIKAIKDASLTEIRKVAAEQAREISEQLQSINARVDGHEIVVSDFNSFKSNFPIQIQQANEKADSRFGQVENVLRSVDETVEALRQRLEQDAQSALTRQKDFNELQVEAVQARVEQARRIETELNELRRQVEQQAQPRATDSQLLGDVLGKNIGVSDDSFRELGEAVNDFFRHQVPATSANLLKLNERGQAIGAGVERLLDKARQIQGLVDSDLGKHVERVRQIVAELSAFCSQLSERQLDLFVTNLRIPVAIHPGARDSFLDELGAAFKREIEKLRQPGAYFERQLRQLATSEIVAITEICDKKVGQSPRVDQDLETELESLFKHAGLESIQPKPGDEFQSSFHDLVEVVSALESGMNRRVARVISRGFSYEEDGRKDLLRKAAVVIYG